MLKQLLLCLSCLLLWSACQRPSDDNCASDFDQSALLQELGGNVILPSYNFLQSSATTLHRDAINFVNAPTINELQILRGSHSSLWTKWQRAMIFEFGPAADAELRTYFNNFPANITRINDGISTGTYDLTTPQYEYARGLPAIDYLLYGENRSDAAIVADFVNNPNRGQYLLDLTALLEQKAQTVHDAWLPTRGNYLNVFTSNTGVENGKPLSDFINQWNAAFELIKNNKLGNPISAKTGYTPLLPDRVEAYYSKQSLDLLQTAVNDHYMVFRGNSNSDVSLKAFLDATGATKGSELLSDVISQQYTELLTALGALRTGPVAPAPFSDLITNRTEDVKAAYAAAQNQVVNIKTDLPAALCVNITYIDNVDDGD